ncbi:MAG: DUF2254 domain-containing protein [Parachlamydiaceae bacterium]|nr:DUF2254 domain-containing protein [Parachlamydiaceae bacterium]
MIKLKSFWNYLHSSLWFLPTLIVGLSIILAIVLIEIESSGSGNGFIERTHLFGSGAQEARIMLSTIAGSMMSVVGITFSMTVVALALASNQYTSRILRNFMRNRLTQLVIGFFVGIFTYCLIVLCTIRTSDEGEFVPSMAVFIAFILALGGVGVLIFFIHHIATSIQASSILSSVAEETFSVIERLYPEKLKNEISEKDENINFKSLGDESLFPILANENGYIQSIDLDKLIQIARDKKIIVRLEHKIGGFVIQNTALVYLVIEQEPAQKTVNLINSVFLFNQQRILEQDVSFGIRQIVDIALKALSPGINDTTTAVMCLNYLTAIMVRLASKKFSPCYHYEDNELRVITKDRNFENFLDESFNQIRENAKENITIILKVLESLRIIATQTIIPSRLKALDKQVRWISEMVRHNIKSLHNRKEINNKIISFYIVFKNQTALN